MQSQNSPYWSAKAQAIMRSKKTLTTYSIILGVLVVSAVAGAVTILNNSSTDNSSEASQAEQDPNALVNFDHKAFALSHPAGLKIFDQESFEDGFGGYVMFAESESSGQHSLEVLVSDTEPQFLNGEEAVAELVGEDKTNINTRDVTIAGVPSKLVSADFTNEGREFVVAYSNAKVGERFVEFTAIYSKENQIITNNINTILSTLRIK